MRPPAAAFARAGKKPGTSLQGPSRQAPRSFCKCTNPAAMAFGLPKRWLRQLSYVGMTFFTFALLIALVDSLYKNILPSEIHNILPYQAADSVLQDFKIEDCSLLNKNCEKEGYTKHPVDLRLGKSWTKKTFLFSKIVAEEQLAAETSVVLDIAVSDQKLPEYVSNDLGKLSLEESGWKYYDFGIWIKHGKFVKGSSVNALDVLFGDDCVDPRPKWKLLTAPVSLDAESGLLPRLTFRRGVAPKVARPHLKVGGESKFKILQVADLHFSTGVGKCLDPIPPESADGCEADPRTIRFLETVMDLEKPDMVVLTGDQIFGETSLDSKTSLFKALAPFIARKIPYSVSMGNHDDEGSLTRSEVMSLAAELPYSLAELGPADVDGVGNYLLTVEAPHSKKPAMSLWFLDSHKYSLAPKTNPGYDWIKESQLNWLQRQYDEIAVERDAYTHIHLSMAFFHIPLPEYTDSKDHVMVGNVKEGCTAPKYNSGAHEVLKNAGVSVLSVGHDHCNDYCLLNDFWLCYGGGAGEGGYGGYGGTARRLRVFEVDTQRNDIRSWKRVETNPQEVIDSQVLVSGGNPVES